MFRAIIGQAQGVDTECTAIDVIQQCRDRLDGVVPRAGLLFSASEFDLKRLTSMVSDAFPDVSLVGCTTAGTFSSALGLSLDSISLVLFVSDTVRFVTGLGQSAQLNAAQAIADASKMILEAHPGLRPSMAFAFPDVMLAPGEMVDTLARTLGCPVFGGFAGGERYQDIRQLFGRQVFTGALTILALFGPAKAAFRVSNSWRPVGRRVRVDAVDGKKVLRIDGKTALEYYRETLGPHALPAIEMPLAVIESNDDFTIRGPHEYDETDGSIVFSDAIPMGAAVRITEASRENLLKDLENSLTELVDICSPDFVPDVALAFSCSARRNILGLRAREEFELMRKILPRGLPILGFHAFGEICPLNPDELSKYHNSTFVTVLLGDGERDGLVFSEQLANSHSSTNQCPTDVIAVQGREIRFLKKQLTRAEDMVTRLELLHDMALTVQSRMNQNLREANLTIQEKNRLLREAMALAEEVQLRLLPRENPVVLGFDIAGQSVYCDETGGDYYDYLAMPGADPGSIAVVVGDVSGHGIASALLMTTARALLRMRASIGGDPARQVGDLNFLLSQDTAETGRFVTLFYLCMEPTPNSPGHGRMRWVRAGHDPALVYDSASGEFLELSAGGVPLGIIGDVTYQEFIFDGMSGGQVVALGTDGIWEARNHERQMFGKRRLRRIIKENADLPAQKIVAAVMEELEAFRRGLPAEDDVTLVIIKVL